MEGLPIAQFIAACGALLAIPLTWRFKLQTGLGVDLYPSMHWPMPRVAQEIELNQGPVLVKIEYQIDPNNHMAFLSAIEEVGRQRKRDGAYAWGVFENIGSEGSFVEAFLIESWLELMHQRERVTNADRVLEDRVRRLLLAPPQSFALDRAQASAPFPYSAAQDGCAIHVKVGTAGVGDPRSCDHRHLKFDAAPGGRVPRRRSHAKTRRLQARVQRSGSSNRFHPGPRRPCCCIGKR